MSQFLHDNDSRTTQALPEIDFDSAVRLPSGGTTCDLFRARWQRREVFVKRLKAQYRAKPLYLDALDKEFDVGAALLHPSLPRYLEFHRDYIVMDYVDGATLAHMIKRGDPWLANEKHITRLLTELVDVVDYLHRHNVVHCDIKPDNIMITSNGKNLVLVDFDKSYTDAQRDTSGHPGKYGLSVQEVGKTTIDFHGIGRVAGQLHSAGFKFRRYKKFVNACSLPDVDCEKLRDILTAKRSTPVRVGLLIAAGLATFGLIGGVVLWIAKSDNSAVGPSIVTSREAATDSIAGAITPSVDDTPPTVQPIPATEAPRAITQEEIHADAESKARQLDTRITPYFNQLQSGLDKLATLRSDTSLTGQQLLDSIRALSNAADEYITEAFTILNEMYPGLTDREAWRIMSLSQAYTDYTRRMAAEGKEFRQEYERRFAREGTQPQ